MVIPSLPKALAARMEGSTAARARVLRRAKITAG
jgi:hypothetical protein